MSNILIAYYSRAGQNYVGGSIENLPVGNAEVIAKMAAEKTGGDLFKIDTVKSYSADYHACTDEAQEEKQSNARPELKEHLDDIEAYDTVILVYPNWWGTMPMAVYTFLEEYDFSGKIILPCCTHEGSGLSSTERDIVKICPGANVGQGLAVMGSKASASANVISAWLEKAL